MATHVKRRNSDLLDGFHLFINKNYNIGIKDGVRILTMLKIHSTFNDHLISSFLGKETNDNILNIITRRLIKKISIYNFKTHPDYNEFSEKFPPEICLNIYKEWLLSNSYFIPEEKTIKELQEEIDRKNKVIAEIKEEIEYTFYTNEEIEAMEIIRDKLTEFMKLFIGLL